jgi:tetratricopeptide (TPR) repeat protein
MNKPEESSKAYKIAAANTKDVNLKAQALNNQGLALIKQKKLAEAIEAFKQSLRLHSFDKEVRENLQKALNELQKQQGQSQDQNKNKSQNKNEDKKKNKSNMSEEQAEKLLKQLQQDEKDTQKQIRQRNRKDRQLKDW